MTEPSVRPLVDVNRSAVLTRYGCGHTIDAAVAVHPDGSESLWVLVAGGDDGPASPPPPHEQTGPLPESYQRRLAQPRCGRPRVDGKPCRTPVAVVGQTCGHHRPPHPAVDVLRERKRQAS